MNRKQRNDRKKVGVSATIFVKRKNKDLVIPHINYSFRFTTICIVFLGCPNYGNNAPSWGHRTDLCRWDNGNGGCFRFENRRVTINRQAARLRAVFHTKADWECPEARIGFCFRCKWQRRCKAIHP